MSQAEKSDALMGYHDLLGMRVVEWQPGRAMIELTIEPKHLNRSNNVHGGVLTSMLDSALSLAGLHCSVPGNIRKGMTLSLTTTFVSPARKGILTATGTLRGGGKKTYMASGEIRDTQGNLVAIGEGSFRRRGGSESPEGVPEETSGKPGE
ncbi:PaaI family thioesterase [Vreelandella populi]|uniref:PaaI family thioesterase n=1 Tax=Vreelandella populi TaxID=2498858 RepID=A0A3S0YFH7_9GAMM|nr:PaaI family thioesterase [Halomonas populi]RUR37373.1 PaaI family thioesterase [Halomonas populi]RUR50462.1 PaaI family thioesterase [Halomonas populi]RUR56830.1 PaaI family thioesterase [Halomonas populi]